MKKVAVFFLGGAMVLSMSLNAVQARPQYKKEFDTMYADKEGSAEQKKLFETISTVKCNVCHGYKDGKTSTKVMNAYGDELKKLMPMKNTKEASDIRAALEKVAAMHAGGDDKAPTYGDKLKHGDLPVEPKPE